MSMKIVNKNSLFSERIKQERLRYGLTQQQIADRCGISREMWGRYERGLAIANCELLFSLFSLGWDVLYIISGSRSQYYSQHMDCDILKQLTLCDDESKMAILTILSKLQQKTG